MKILFVTPYPIAPANDGGRRRALEVALALHERAEITVVCAAPRAGMLPKMPFPVYTYAKDGFRFQVINPLLTVRLARLLSSQRFDIIWMEQIWNGLAVAFGRLHHRVPIYLDAPDVVSALPQQLPWPFRLFIGPYERLVTKLADRIFVVSLVDKARLMKRGVHSDKIEILPNGVDTREFRPDPAARNRVRQDLGVTIDQKLLLFFGQLGYYPNYDALRAFADLVLPKVGSGYRLLVVGRGMRQEDRIRLGGLPNVILAGEVDQVADYVTAADVVVVPLRFGTGTRLKILESVACGAPVLTTSVGAEGLALAALGPRVMIEDDWDNWPAAIDTLSAFEPSPPPRTFIEACDWRSIFSNLRLPLA